MAHLTFIDKASASPEVTDIYNEIKAAFGRVPNLFKTYAHHPALLEANWHKVKRVMMEGSLSPKTKETIALLVSKDNGCKYCVTAHTGALKAIGVSREEISKLESDLDHADLSHKERALIKFARKANRAAVETSDDEFANARQAGATDAEVVEALGVMEVFTSFNKFLDTLHVENDS